ncbi:MAG: hypothetical protein COA58_03055 [Bacteroidetes bacterium]|nr:MAG: hypothetical protein COA58_03055 [Bacteroidota bacterium]
MYTDDLTTCDLNYSVDSGNGLQIIPHVLLGQDDINKDVTVVFEQDEYQWFTFRTSNTLNCPFDIFASAFYLVSRYEEYLPFDADDHSRFPAHFSCLASKNLFEEPLVNQWALYIRDKLLHNNPSLAFIPRSFEFQSTIDIDQAWKFKNKGLFRSLSGTVRDLVKGKWENLLARWPILLGLKPDPFYNFDWQQEVHSKLNIKVQYFILLGNYGPLDKNTSHTNKYFQKLIKQLSKLKDTNVGIHPSYQSNTETHVLEEEIDRLAIILKTKVTASRQHFLMHKMPQTYSKLAARGIKEEHTMGYSTHLGFRAGIAAPFYWFDLQANKATDMELVPFCAMDITPLHYRNESPDEAMQSLESLMQKVKDVGGLFVSLWHNESFSETERWKGWQKVYSHLLNLAKR